MPTTDTSIEVADTSTTGPITDGAMAEIPFVPAPLRQAVKPEVIDDAIIVVGQRQKKRKRTKMVGAGGEGSSEKSSTPVAKAKAELDVVPFDFASAPNLLDDSSGNHSEQEEKGRAGKRKRPKKGSGMCRLIPLPSAGPFTDYAAGMVVGTRFVMIGTALERGSFPAAPKDRRELRSGNVTHTFRP
jgi:exosome complex exonuclease RRP6